MREKLFFDKGKWSADYDEHGKCIKVAYDKDYIKLLGAEPVDEADSLKLWKTIIHPDDIKLLDDTYDELFNNKEEGRDYDFECRMLVGSEYHWFHCFGLCERREDGSVSRINGVMFDIQNVVERQDVQEELSQNIQRFFTLEDNFESLYDVNLESGKYTAYNKGEFYQKNVLEKIDLPEDFFISMHSNIDTVIYEEDRESTYFVEDKNEIIKRLSENDFIDHYYRIKADNGTVWLKLRIVYKNAEKKNVIIGVFNADKEMTIKLKEEQKSDEMAENYARILALEDNFEVLYDVELESGRYDIFVKGQTLGEASKNFINNNSFFDDVKKNLDAVHPDDQQGNLDSTRPEFISKALSADDHFDRYYRLMVDGEPVWARMRIVYKNSEKKNIIIGVFNAENDVEAKQISEQKELLERQQIQIIEALESARIETKRNDVLSEIIEGAKFSYDISVDDEIVGAHYIQASIDRIGEQYTSTPMGWFEVLHPADKDRVYEAFMATIHDHTGKTLYSVTFRMMGTNGKYRWVRSGGNVIRRPDGTGEFFGISIDITDQMEEQQKRLLGAVPMTPDILSKANIGLWSFELDEGQPPRMYGDEAMIKLVGLDKQVSPEEMYHAWYDHIDEGSYDLVTDVVSKMTSGEHAEVQYPWHYSDGRTIMVRCGGVRNYEYKKGIRIEGTHQDVTQTLHFDEEERKRAKQVENDLIISKLRADSLAYISDNDPDLDNAINFFGEKILDIFNCDQVVYREIGGRKIVLNMPGVEEVPETICSKCPFSKFDCDAFGDEGVVMMNDCSKGYHGVMAPDACPAKSSFMQLIYSGGKLVGKFTVHYLNEYHTFTEDGIGIMKTVAIYLGLLIVRIKEKQANIARIEAEFSNKAKTEFLFNMSHDIRTPMNAILGYTDIALNHVDEPERISDSLKKIKTSGGHLLKLINDILEMSRIEAGRLEIVNSPINIYEVTESVIHMSEALASTKDITFKAVIGEIRNPYVLSDELHTNQIIINLISNAIKYTNPGGTVEYNIDQLSEPVDNIARYRVTVRDNGIGMSEDFQDHLFESFSREQTSTVSKQEGAGLGLAIVKNIVDIIGGTISVQSTKGEGTKFIVELPLEVMDNEAIKAFNAKSDNPFDLEEEYSFNGKRVLLVEDNEMNREIATDILTETGLVIDTAEDGALAVKKVREVGTGYYDFILMDIQMPVMNGYEATAQIRKLPGGEKETIIALSANAFKEDIAKSIEKGMNAHVAKPINVKELFRVMSQFENHKDR